MGATTVHVGPDARVRTGERKLARFMRSGAPLGGRRRPPLRKSRQPPATVIRREA